MKRIFMIALSLCLLLSGLTVALAEGTDSTQSQTIQNTEKVKIPQELKDKMEAFKELNTETTKLFSELKAAKNENPVKVKDLLQQLKAAIKARDKEKVSHLMDQIIQLEQGQKEKREEIKSIQADLKNMRETMKGYTSELKGYLQSKDYTNAGLALDKMIQLKKDINSKLSKLLQIKE